jgi:hypothetical protein
MSSGAYVVTTASGSRYLIDTSAKILRRVPAANAPTESSMLHDNAEIIVVWLGQLEVGRTLPMILDLQLPGLHDTFRRTTPIVNIEHLDEVQDLECGST